MSTHRIAVVNAKGGSAKTTTAVNLAAALAEVGEKVVLVDTDPFAGASSAFGEVSEGPTLSDVLFTKGRVPLSETIREVGVEGLRLIPSDPRLARLEPDLVNDPTLLRDALAPLRGIDFLIVDTPPASGPLAVAAVVASKVAVVPVPASSPDLARLPDTLGILGTIRDQRVRDLDLLLVPSRTTATNLSREVVDRLRREFRGSVSKVEIPASIRVGECHAHGKSILDHDRRGRVAESFRQLAKELRRRVKK